MRRIFELVMASLVGCGMAALLLSYQATTPTSTPDRSNHIWRLPMALAVDTNCSNGGPCTTLADPLTLTGTITTSATTLLASTCTACTPLITTTATGVTGLTINNTGPPSTDLLRLQSSATNQLRVTNFGALVLGAAGNGTPSNITWSATAANPTLSFAGTTGPDVTITTANTTGNAFVFKSLGNGTNGTSGNLVQVQTNVSSVLTNEMLLSSAGDITLTRGITWGGEQINSAACGTLATPLVDNVAACGGTSGYVTAATNAARVNFSPAFSSLNNYECQAFDATTHTYAGITNIANTSSSQVTFSTSGASDKVSFICQGVAGG